ncbi:MAG: 30S ribosomal protein THX [Pyrinomonadaceae bacterium]
MGKGDKRTKRGKIFAGSYGKTRQKPHKTAFVATEKPVVEKAPKKRTPKVVKSAPAPEPVSEPGAEAQGSAGTEAVSATEQTGEAPAAEAAPEGGQDAGAVSEEAAA